MEVKHKTISPAEIKAAITEKTLILKRKQQLHEEVQKIERELKTLNESAQGLIGSFGFSTPQDVATRVSKTGFVNNFQNISHIAQLAQDMAEENTSKKSEPISEDIMNEFARMKEELSRLTKENDELKKNNLTQTNQQ